MAADALMLSQLSPPPPNLSLRLCGFLPLGGVHGGHVLGGGDEVQEADAGLEQADDPAESLQPVEPAGRLLDVMENVEQTEEELVPGTHHKQNRLGGVVEAKDGVPGEVDGFVTRRSFYRRAVQVQPVAGDVQTHAELEQEGVGGVEQGQVDQQTHGGTAVSQHVHHGAELGGLIERPRGVAIEGVEQGAEQVAEDGRPRAAGHQVEGDQGQHHPGVTD